MKPVKRVTAILLPLLFMLISCGTMTASFDQYAYAQTTAAKVEAMDLISHATQNVSGFTTQIRDVDLKLKKIYEYEKNRPKNDITVKMWQLLLDPEKRLYGGFIKRWQTDSTLSKAFVEEASMLIGSGFDKVAELESKKIPRNDDAIKSFQ
ncbi:MAG TPA: hypothetical protein VLC28_07085 [Flavitalea sp.]|nr:hypothetical protein [Flavitalea sp.]